MRTRKRRQRHRKPYASRVNNLSACNRSVTTRSAKTNERCDRNPDGSLALNEHGQVVFAAGSFDDFLSTPDGKKMIGPTGGVQGMKGTLFGMPYASGSWQDQLIEAFAGPHDYIGGSVSGLYDEQGNARRERSTTEAFAHDRWSEIAIPIAAPFAAAKSLPPEVWTAISVLLRGSK